jgi:hypothetical protein
MIGRSEQKRKRRRGRKIRMKRGCGERHYVYYRRRKNILSI